MRVSLVSILLAVAVGACASAEPAATTTTVDDTLLTTMLTTTTSRAASTTTTTITSPSTASTTPELDVEFVGGEAVGPAVFEVALGETVDIWIRSDVDDEVHVHGYDLTYPLVAGEPLHLSFIADVPGIFEVEVHTGHTVLFEVEVSG
ncbi:MAG: hypothetical protein ACLFRT_01965 [Actinomycetota bacterium]